MLFLGWPSFLCNYVNGHRTTNTEDSTIKIKINRQESVNFLTLIFFFNGCLLFRNERSEDEKRNIIYLQFSFRLYCIHYTSLRTHTHTMPFVTLFFNSKGYLNKILCYIYNTRFILSFCAFKNCSTFWP